MERSEVRAVGRRGAGDGQAREAFVGELQVRGRARRLAVPVEARLEPLDEAQLADLGLERGRADAVVDRRELAQQLRNLAAVVRREVGAHAGAQVRRLADVEHPPVAIAEDVDAGRGGEPGGERQLRGRRMRAHRRQREEVVEPEDAVARSAFEQRVQHLGRRRRVGVGAVRRLDARAEVARERVQRRLGISSRTRRRASASVSTRRFDRRG